MDVEKARKGLDIATKSVAILGLIAMGFAVWFSIRFAKSKTKQEMDNRQIYFNAIHANFNRAWAQNAYWDSVKMETNTYAAKYILDEEPHHFDYTLSIRKEDFNDQYNTQTQAYDRPDIYEVMKVHASASIHSNDSFYNFLTSMYFLRMNALVLHKMTQSSQDWMGNTFKHYFNTKSIIEMHYNSYWDREGIGHKIFNKDLLFEDQLVYTLRSLDFKEGLNFNAQVLETQVLNKVGQLHIYPANFEVKDIGMYKDIPCWKVEVKLDSLKSNEYYFTKEYPNTLLKFKSWDWREWVLKQNND